MNIKDYLINEIKRLNRMNDLLEKEAKKTEILIEKLNTSEELQKNTLAMCEIAKVCDTTVA